MDFFNKSIASCIDSHCGHVFDLSSTIIDEVFPNNIIHDVWHKLWKPQLMIFRDIFVNDINNNLKEKFLNNV